MKYKTILASGYWLDTQEPFNGKMVALGSFDGIEDAEDEHIFYYLDGAEPIGEHDGFVITFYEEKNND